MRYGVPYKGSKNAIAKWVVDQLPAGNRLVDLFAGGCAVTHCAMLSGKWNEYLINDINDTPQLFLDAIHGKYHDDYRWISRDEFFFLKDADPYVRQCWSFGNGAKSYMYSREIEPYKKAVHFELTSPTVHERYMWHRKAVRELLSLFKGGGGQQLTDIQENIERLQSLESLERLQRLESLESLQTDYRNVQLRDGDIVYCDIPYKNTSTKNEYGAGFDYDAFYEWCEAQTVPVFISEYSMPDDRFECVAKTTRHGHLSATNKSRHVTEKLYTVRR